MNRNVLPHTAKFVALLAIVSSFSIQLAQAENLKVNCPAPDTIKETAGPHLSFYKYEGMTTGAHEESVSIIATSKKPFTDKTTVQTYVNDLGSLMCRYETAGTTPITATLNSVMGIATAHMCKAYDAEGKVVTNSNPLKGPFGTHFECRT